MKSMAPPAMFSGDLMLEVIFWLPIRSVQRFKSVCKLWHSIISNPYFTSTHNRRRDEHPDSEIILGVGASYFYSSLSADDDALVTHLLPDPPYHHMLAQTMSITHTCSEIDRIDFVYMQDGLLLYQLNVSANKNKFVLHYLYNPITTAFRQIPIPELKVNFHDHEPYPKKLLLIPNDCVLMLEYESMKEEQKVRCNVRLYSFKIGEWENCGKSLVHEGWFSFAPGVFWNGSANWIAMLKTSNDLVIMSFNIEKYEWREIQLAEKDERRLLIPLYFGKSRDRLHLIVSETGRCWAFDVLEFVGDISQWSVLYHVDFGEASTHDVIKEIYSPVLYFLYEAWALNLVPGLRKEDDKLFLHGQSKIVSYNLMDKTVCHVVPAEGLSPHLCRFYEVISYSPSLAFPWN